MKSLLGNGILLLALLTADLGMPVWLKLSASQFSFLEAGFALSLCLSPGPALMSYSGVYGIAADIAQGQSPGPGILPFATCALVVVWSGAARRASRHLMLRVLLVGLVLLGLTLLRTIALGEFTFPLGTSDSAAVSQFRGTCLLALFVMIVAHTLTRHNGGTSSEDMWPVRGQS